MFSELLNDKLKVIKRNGEIIEQIQDSVSIDTLLSLGKKYIDKKVDTLF